MNNGNTITKSQLSRLVASLDERFDGIQKALSSLAAASESRGGYEEIKALSEGVASLQSDFDTLTGRLSWADAAIEALTARVRGVEGVSAGLGAVNAAIAQMTREIEGLRGSNS